MRLHVGSVIALPLLGHTCRGSPARGAGDPPRVYEQNRATTRRRSVPIHSITYALHASAVDDIEAINSAMKWLIDDLEPIQSYRQRSHHGADMQVYEIRLMRSGMARQALARLGPKVLSQISKTLQTKIDKNRVLHVRLSLDALVRGQVALSLKSGSIIKIRAKLRVHSNEDPVEIGLALIEAAIERAERMGWPEKPLNSVIVNGHD